MENINELKEEISVAIQQLIDMDLEQLKVYLDLDEEEFDPDNLCAALERTEENLELIKEKAEELAELFATNLEMERAKDEEG